MIDSGLWEGYREYISSVYFSIMTLSTIGYGDIVPVILSPS